MSPQLANRHEQLQPPVWLRLSRGSFPLLGICQSAATAGAAGGAGRVATSIWSAPSRCSPAVSTVVPHHSLLLHWRYYNDPPEFFTLLLGDMDGLHWGYYLDDSATQSGCVASYYTNDAFELMPDGDTLFEALRLDLEQRTAIVWNTARATRNRPRGI